MFQNRRCRDKVQSVEAERDKAQGVLMVGYRGS